MRSDGTLPVIVTLPTWRHHSWQDHHVHNALHQTSWTSQYSIHPHSHISHTHTIYSGYKYSSSHRHPFPNIITKILKIRYWQIPHTLLYPTYIQQTLQQWLSPLRLMGFNAFSGKFRTFWLLKARLPVTLKEGQGFLSGGRYLGCCICKGCSQESSVGVYCTYRILFFVLFCFFCIFFCFRKLITWLPINMNHRLTLRALSLLFHFF